MDIISQKAADYAANKVNESLTKAIADAYVAGYNAACKEHNANPVVVVEDGVEYVDLGLPSGTLWAKNFLKQDGKYVYLPYVKACELNIPTEEQFDELTDCCRFYYDNDSDVFTILGMNGEEIRFSPPGFKTVGDKIDSFSLGLKFWIDAPENKTSCATQGIIHRYTERYRQYVKVERCDEFMGNKLPVMLVKSK